MKHQIFGIAAIIVVYSVAPAAADERPLMLNARFVIPKEEIPSIANEALNGSGKAAIRLYNYYGKILLDDQQASRWIQIAAENGDTAGQYNFAVELLARKDEESKRRAAYWLRVAAEQGDAPSKELLEKIERARSNGAQQDRVGPR